MPSIAVASFLIATAAAQSTVTLINFIQPATSLTAVASSADTTTYQNVCPTSSGQHRSSSFQGTLAPKPTITDFFSTIAPVPTETTKARLRRQDEVESDSCEPYTLVQGDSTWQFHMTDPEPGAWTVNADCNWEGASTTADITCTATQSGSSAMGSGVSSTVWKASDLSTFGGYLTVAVVSGSASGPASSVAPSKSASSGSASSASAPSGSASGSAASSSSTGIAPGIPLPTGSVALIGGVAGVFAAALAL